MTPAERRAGAAAEAAKKKEIRDLCQPMLTAILAFPAPLQAALKGKIDAAAALEYSEAKVNLATMKPVVDAGATFYQRLKPLQGSLVGIITNPHKTRLEGQLSTITASVAGADTAAAFESATEKLAAIERSMEKVKVFLASRGRVRNRQGKFNSKEAAVGFKEVVAAGLEALDGMESVDEASRAIGALDTFNDVALEIDRVHPVPDFLATHTAAEIAGANAVARSLTFAGATERLKALKLLIGKAQPYAEIKADVDSKFAAAKNAGTDDLKRRLDTDRDEAIGEETAHKFDAAAAKMAELNDFIDAFNEYQEFEEALNTKHDDLEDDRLYIHSETLLDAAEAFALALNFTAANEELTKASTYLSDAAAFLDVETRATSCARELAAVPRAALEGKITEAAALLAPPKIKEAIKKIDDALPPLEKLKALKKKVAGEVAALPAPAPDAIRRMIEAADAALVAGEYGKVDEGLNGAQTAIANYRLYCDRRAVVQNSYNEAVRLLDARDNTAPARERNVGKAALAAAMAAVDAKVAEAKYDTARALLSGVMRAIPPAQAEKMASDVDRRDRGHSVARHGAQVTRQQLEVRIDTGYAPDGVYSPTATATRFASPVDWLATREAALAGAAKAYGIDLNKAPEPGEAKSHVHIEVHNRSIGEGYTGKPRTLVEGLTKTQTTIEWNQKVGRWQVKQHFPSI
jgi:hypothetical protein